MKNRRARAGIGGAHSGGVRSNGIVVHHTGVDFLHLLIVAAQQSEQCAAVWQDKIRLFGRGGKDFWIGFAAHHQNGAGARVDARFNIGVNPVADHSGVCG